MDEPRKLIDILPLPLQTGGLFRCCLVKWERDAPSADATKEGDILKCEECGATMVVKEKKWVWNQDGVKF